MGVIPIDTAVTAKNRVKKSQPLTIDYMHILPFDLEECVATPPIP